MKRQKIGKILFWIGSAGLFVHFIATCRQNHIIRANTPETLIGTGWSYNEIYTALFGLALSFGFLFSLIGALLYSSKKGSFFWLLGFVPVIVLTALLLWDPSTHFHVIYGIGAAIISLSFLGILWGWIKTYSTYDGFSKTGKQIQLIGYSFFYITALLLCSHIGNPINPGGKGFPVASGYSILIAITTGFILLSVGHYLTGKQKK